jgi:DNA-directed RNA polymerase III subunit RPC8
MFILVKLKDKVRIDPSHFEKEYNTAIKDEIHLRYSKKVLPNVGLCISIYEFLKIGEPFIIPGDGASFTEVEFQMIVFKPFLGEILDGIVVASDFKKGLTVSVGFFHDIVIPAHLLQENTQLYLSIPLF